MCTSFTSHFTDGWGPFLNSLFTRNSFWNYVNVKKRGLNGLKDTKAFTHYSCNENSYENNVHIQCAVFNSVLQQRKAVPVSCLSCIIFGGKAYTWTQLIRDKYQGSRLSTFVLDFFYLWEEEIKVRLTKYFCGCNSLGFERWGGRAVEEVRLLSILWSLLRWRQYWLLTQVERSPST